MINSQRLLIKTPLFIQILVLVLVLAGCVAYLKPEPLFGLSDKASPAEGAVVNVRRLYSGQANGVWVYRAGLPNAEFTTKNTILLPPGDYNFKVLSLTRFEVVQKGNVTVKKDHYYDVPLTVQAGKKYELSRTRTGVTETIEAREIEDGNP